MHSNPQYKNLVRLNTDGSLDESFYVNDDIIANRVTALALQEDNKIVFSCDSSIYKVNANGDIDAGFTKGVITNDFNTGVSTRISDLKIQSGNKILVSGSFTSYNNNHVKNILRLNTDGSIDNSFSTGTGFGSGNHGGSVDGRIDNIELFDDGRIFIAGGFLFYRGVWQGTMAVLNNDGSINQTFNADNGNGADANVNKMSVQPDNKILIAGYFSSYDGVSRNKIARLNVDGTLDNSFNPGTGPDSCNFINTVALQKDGKILAGGNFAHFNGIAKSYIVRLNADGSLDNSFSFTGFEKTYGDMDDGAKVIAVQTDGKIITGFQTSENYITNQYKHTLVLRLNIDGSIDNSFNASALNNNFYAEVYSIQIQKDNKIIVVGDFSITGSNKKNLIRLNSDGSLDNSFNANSSGANGEIYATGIQSDGKILIAGDFSSYNNISINKLARLNTDGSLDQSYLPTIPDVETDINYITNPFLIVNNDNKVLFSYLYFADTIFGRVIRYNTDGSIDSVFGLENKTDFLVSDIALQNQKLLLAGFIESFNGIKRNRITRITTPEVLPVTWISVNTVIKNLHDVGVTWQTANELNVKNYTVQRSINGTSFSNLSVLLPGKGLSNKYVYTEINGALAASKVYYRILETDNDGKNSYSQITFVTKDENSSITIAPNPAQNVLHVKNLNADIINTLVIINAKGDVVNSFKSSSNNFDIDVSKLSSGSYYLKIVSGSTSHLFKFIKE